MSRDMDDTHSMWSQHSQSCSDNAGIKPASATSLPSDKRNVIESSCDDAIRVCARHTSIPPLSNDIDEHHFHGTTQMYGSDNVDRAATNTISSDNNTLRVLTSLNQKPFSQSAHISSSSSSSSSSMMMMVASGSVREPNAWDCCATNSYHHIDKNDDHSMIQPLRSYQSHCESNFHQSYTTSNTFTTSSCAQPINSNQSSSLDVVMLLSPTISTNSSITHETSGGTKSSHVWNTRTTVPTMTVQHIPTHSESATTTAAPVAGTASPAANTTTTTTRLCGSFNTAPQYNEHSIVQNNMKHTKKVELTKPQTVSVKQQRNSSVISKSPQHTDSSPEKCAHGFFKIWHRNVSPHLRQAYDAIFGVPLYGSLSFISLRTSIGFYNLENMMKARFEGEVCVSACLGSHDSQHRVHMQAVSGGKDDGDCARLLLNGRDYSENSRGLNLVVIDAISGSVYTQSVFDTHGSPSEASRLAIFLESIQSGHIVLGAVRDDAAKFLLQSGRNALRSLGLKLPLADDSQRLASVIAHLPLERTQPLLTVCAKSNASRCARLLLERGWNVGFRAAHTQNTPLHDAVYQCHADVASVLLEHGAHAGSDVLNRWSESASDIARTRHDFSTIEELLVAGSAPVKAVLRYLDL